MALQASITARCGKAVRIQVLAADIHPTPHFPTSCGSVFSRTLSDILISWLLILLQHRVGIWQSVLANLTGLDGFKLKWQIDTWQKQMTMFVVLVFNIWPGSTSSFEEFLEPIKSL